jgi:hypothetical protein
MFLSNQLDQFLASMLPDVDPKSCDRAALLLAGKG